MKEKESLVVVRNNETFADSRVIAEKLGKQHKHVLDKIDRLQGQKECFKERIRKYRGQDFRYFEMNVEGFLKLVASFTGGKTNKKKNEILKIVSKTINNFDKIIEAINNFDVDDIPVRYIYAVEDNIGNLKIGISNNPERRIKELNIGNPDELKLVCVKETQYPKFKDETLIHKQAEPYHIRSEWFKSGAREFLN